MNQRFEEDFKSIRHFGRNFLVECPSCFERAMVINRNEEGAPQVTFSCGHCGHSRAWESKKVLSYSIRSQQPEAGLLCIGGPFDWYFHLPLWLRVSCCGETLWAYNAEHLNYLEEYVGAKLRERMKDQRFGWSNRSLPSRLPVWMKSAKNREEILKCIAKLKSRLR